MYIMVFGQRRLRMPGDLPDVPPAGWAALREEMLTLVKEGEEGLLTVPGMLVEEEGDDPASMVFVVVTDSREFPFRGPFMREVSFLGAISCLGAAADWVVPMLQSDRTCGECGEKFESWSDCQIHRKEVHGANIWDGVPDDL